MAVYVDDIYQTNMGAFRRMKMSHMIADTDDELHEMAAKIGIKRQWHQGDHYDVAMAKRELAISLGAIAITLRQLASMNFLRRSGQPMGDPETAIRRMLILKGNFTQDSAPRA